jgi:hypothetical protein
MKIILALTTLGLFLTACTTTTTDVSIHRRLVGVWSLEDSQPGTVIENRADGTTVKIKNGAETDRGTWQVKDGYLIVNIIGSSTLESNKVLNVSGDKAILLSIDGHTQLTVHRQ